MKLQTKRFVEIRAQAHWSDGGNQAGLIIQNQTGHNLIFEIIDFGELVTKVLVRTGSDEAVPRWSDTGELAITERE